MTVGPDVSEFIESAVSYLRTADIISLSMNVRNAEAMARNAYAFATPTPTLENTLALAVEAIRKFGLMASQGSSYRFTPDDTVNRNEAMIAVQVLGTELANAQPNDYARALGLG